MKNKKGFTLIEILAVIVIIGIILIIAVPSVTKYIFKSKKSTYAANVSAYLETVRAHYDMKEYGSLLKDDEIMLIPIGHVILEKGDSLSSPYGDYDFSRSYILIVPERSGYKYYATVIDSESVGLISVPENQIDEDAIKEEITTNIVPIETYSNAAEVFNYNGRAYRRSDVRQIETGDSNSGYYAYVFKDTGVMQTIKVMQLFSIGTHAGIVGTLEYFYETWRLRGESVTSVEPVEKVGYTFQGYFTGFNGEGTQTIEESGRIVSGIEESLGSYTAVYAHFMPNPLIFNGGTKTITYKDNNQNITITGATNGTAHYTYTEVSEQNSSGTSTNYMSINGTTITVNGGTPVGTYTYKVHVKDNVSGSEEDATFTIVIQKAASSITCTDRTYNGEYQNMYTAYNGCTPTTNSSVLNATEGSFTVLCEGDTNHNNSTCTAKMNKATAVLTCSDKTYNGQEQTGCACTGGSLTEEYKATNYRSTAYTANCSPDSNHNAPTSKTWKINKKALTIKANDQTIDYGQIIIQGVGQVTVTGLVSGDSLTGVTLVASTSSATTNGTITPSNGATSKGITNYSVTYQPGVLKINKVVATLTCTDRTYNGTSQNMYTNSTGCSIVTNGAQIGVGEWTLSCYPDSNHTAPTTCTATMNQKALTIKAKDQTIDYGQSIATGVSQVTATGLVSGDSLTTITLTPSTTNATTSGKITPSGGTTTNGLGNYRVTYTPGTLVINKVSATLTCSDKTYTGSAQNLYSTATGCTSVTNGRKTNAGGPWTLTCVADDNHTAPATCTAKMNKAASSITCETAKNYSGSAQTSYTASSGCNTITNGSVTNAGTYTVTCNGDSNHNDSSCSFTINKVAATLTCTNRTYNGSAQNLYSNATGCRSVTNGSKTDAGGPWTLTCVADDNHTAPNTCTAKMNSVKCNAPTNISVGVDGKVTWTASSNCSTAQHQISIDGTNWTNASSGVNYNSTITAAAGSRTVYVRAYSTGNYTTSDSANATAVTVYTVTLTKGTGIASVSGAGRYIKGASVTINATLNSGYSWDKWTGTPNTTTQKYTATINGNWTATANGKVSYTSGIITYDYQDTLQYVDIRIMDTGFKPDWSKNFTINQQVQINYNARQGNTDYRYLVIGNYGSGNKKHMSIVVKNGVFRLLMNNGSDGNGYTGGVDEQTSHTYPASATSANPITLVFNWTASTSTYDLTISCASFSDHFTGTYAMSGVSPNTFRINRDYRNATEIQYYANSINGNLKDNYLRISYKQEAGAYVDNLPASRNGFTFFGWHTAKTGGTNIGSTTPVNGNATYYQQYKENWQWYLNCNCENGTLVTYWYPEIYDTEEEARTSCNAQTTEFKDNKCKNNCSSYGGLRNRSDCIETY